MTACCPLCGHATAAPASAVWEFDVPRQIQSGNARNVNTRRNNGRYTRTRDGWVRDMLASRRVYRIPIAVARRRVTLTRLIGKGGKLMDADNLAAAMKIPLDAMRAAELIRDDSPKWVDVEVRQERSADYGLRVLIEELEAT